ncbi:MAG: S-adenosylmethionine decarboxylase [Acidobacteria bacterium]|nr:S-adenosylmethionine decarboxylase [Acidobacteriota bacterium]
MLDLWCHTRARPLTRITGALVRPFAWLDQRLPALRRHGYLLASVGVKPVSPGTGHTAGPSTGGADGPHWQLPEASPTSGAVQAGAEYVIDARGCDPDALRSLSRLQGLFTEVQADLGLHPLAPPVWYVFPGQGGITGVVLLSESHLTVHTYPETGLAAINLYCCRPSIDWAWESRVGAYLSAREVIVRVLPRG